MQAPSRPRCSCGRDGGFAAVGHSRCRHPSAFEEQWTQPCGTWHGGHSLWSLACSPCPVIYHERFVESGADGHLWGICLCWTLRGALHSLSHAEMHGLCGRRRLHSQAYLQMPAAEDLLWIYTAFWRLSGAYAVTIFSFASSLYCQNKTGTDFAVLYCRCSICCCCCCNNLFLGCYMATRPRRASCPRL